jgi:hypothetical protein
MDALGRYGDGSGALLASLYRAPQAPDIAQDEGGSAKAGTQAAVSSDGVSESHARC